MADESVSVTVQVYGDTQANRDEVVATKVIRLALNLTVEEAIEHIATQTRRSPDGRGLYQPIGPGVVEPRWLVADQKLFGRVEADSELYFKLIKRRVRVQILGDKATIVEVDDSFVIRQIIFRISDQIGLTNPEEYGVKRPEDKDDNSKWLPLDRTLENAGIMPGESLLFMKKIHFYDRFIDEKDEVALNMLYSQIRDSILDGTLKLDSEDEVATFGSIIYLNVVGPYDEDKASSTIDDLSPFVPNESKWLKSKKLGPMILKRYKALGGPTLRKYTSASGAPDHTAYQNAYVSFMAQNKSKFTQLARTKALYGYVYFEASMKQRRRRALRKSSKFEAKPVILALGRDYLLVLNPKKNNEVMIEHHYQEVLQWQGTGNKLTVDCAEYEDNLLTFLTPHAEPIAEYMRSYIALHRRRVDDPIADAIHLNGDIPEESRGYPDDGPSAGRNFVIRPKDEEDDDVPSDITEVKLLIEELPLDNKKVVEGPPLDAASDEERLVVTTKTKDNIQSELVRASKAAQLLMLKSMDIDGDDYDAADLLRAARNLDDALSKLIGEVGTAAGISDEDGDDCLDDMQRLAANASVMVKAATVAALGTAAGEVDTIAYGDLLEASRDVGFALKNLLGSTQVIGTINDIPELPSNMLDLLAAADAVAAALKDMNGVLPHSAAEDSPEAVLAATVARLSLEADKLKSYLSLASVAYEDEDQLKDMGDKVEAIRLELASLDDQIAALPPGNDDLLAAAVSLRDALALLIGSKDKVLNPEDRAAEIEETAGLVRADVAGLIDLISSSRLKKKRLLVAMKGVANDAARLGLLADLEAQSVIDSELQKSLLNAAKDLSEAMMNLISASTALSKSLDSDRKKRKTIEAAANVGDYAAQFMMVRRRMVTMNALVKQSKITIDAVKLTNDEAALEVNDIRNESRKVDLERSMASSQDPRDALMNAIYVFLAAPNDVKYQAQLITVAGTGVRKFTNLAQASKAAAALSDDSVYLLSAAQALADALAALKGALKDASSACWQIEIDAALSNMQESVEDAEIAIQDFEGGHLEPESNATQQSAQDELLTNVSSMSGYIQMASAAVLDAKYPETSSAIKAMADEIQFLVDAAEAVAVNSASPETTDACLRAGAATAHATLAFANVAKTGLLHNSDPALPSHVEAAANKLNDKLLQLRQALPGIGTIDRAVNDINETVMGLDPRSLPSVDSEDSFEAAREEMSGSVRALASGLLQLHPAANESPDALGEAVTTVRDLAMGVLAVAAKCAALTEVTTARSSIVASAKSAGDAVVAALLATKDYASDFDSPDTAKELRAAADTAGGSLEMLLRALASGELVEGDSLAANCEAAASRLRDAAQKLTLDNLPDSDESAFKDAQTQLLGAAKETSQSADQLTLYAKSGKSKKIGGAAVELADVASNALTAVLFAAASLPGTGGAGVSASVFKTPVKKCLDAIRVMIQADSAGKPDKAMLKTVASVGRAVMGLSSFIEEKAEAVEEESVVKEMKVYAHALEKAARKLILAAGAYVPKRTDSALKSKFLSKAKAVAVKCTKLNDFAKIRFAGADKSSKSSSAALALAIRQKKMLESEGGESSAAAASGEGLSSVALATLGGAGALAQLPPSVAAQLNLLDLASELADALCRLIGSAAMAGSSPDDASVLQMLDDAARPASVALGKLIEATRYAGPGEAACEAAIGVGAGVVKDLAEAGLNVSVSGVAHVESPEHGLFVNALLVAARDLSDDLNGLVVGAGTSPKELASGANTLSASFKVFGEAGVKAASSSADVASAAQTLRLCKDVVEQSVSVLRSARDAGGDSSEAKALRSTQAGNALTAESLQSLVDFLGSLAASGHDCDVAIVNIENATKVLDRKTMGAASSKSYKECEKALRVAAKKLVGAMAKIVHASKDDPGSLGGASKDAAKVFPDLVAAVMGEMALVGDSSVGEGLSSSMRGLSGACITLVEAAKAVEQAPSDASAKAQVSEASEGLTAAITALLMASKQVGAMQKESEEAKRIIEEALVELSTSLYLSSNGQLYVRATETFKSHEDKIDGQCKTVAHAVSELLKGADGPATALGGIALHSAQAVKALVLVVVAAASGLEDADAQHSLLEAAKALAEAFIVFIGAAQAVADASVGSAARKKAKKALKHQAKAVAMTIAAMINVAREAAGAALVGAKALAAAAKAIAAAAADLDGGVASPAGAAGTVGAEEVVPAAKATNTAAAKLYFASTKTQDVVAAKADGLSGDATKLFGLVAAAAAAPNVDDADASSLLDAARALAEALAGLLGDMMNPSVSGDALGARSRAVGSAVATLVSVVSFMGTSGSGGEDDSPAGAAERELLSAASSIEDAAARLRTLQSEAAAASAASEAAGRYHSSLLGNCLGMAEAAGELVRAATVAQQEIVATGGEHEGSVFHEDPKWAEGLISAAREVVAATEQLVIYADAFVKGDGDDAYIVAASQVVSSSTAHLVMAARAKAPSLTTEPQQRLDKAAKGVKRATRDLVATIEVGIEDEDSGDSEESLSMVQKFQRQEKIARMEEQLRQLQQNLNKAL